MLCLQSLLRRTDLYQTHRWSMTPERWGPGSEVNPQSKAWYNAPWTFLFSHFIQGNKLTEERATRSQESPTGGRAGSQSSRPSVGSWEVPLGGVL